ncbi:MAG: Sec-independent protein translocase protein TatB [Rhizobium sp.]
MFDVGWSELVVIAVVALVVIGPKELPTTLRTIGKMTARARKVAGEFRAQFDEAMREADLDDVRQTISDAQKLNPVNSLREAMNPLRQMGNDIKADLQRATTSDKPVAATPLPSEPLVEPGLGLPETPPAVPAASSAPVVAAPAPAAAASEAAAKPKPARKPRAKTPAKADEVAAVVATPVVAEKPKRAPRAKVAAAGADAPAAAAKKRQASKTTPKKKDEA